jgi:hypothetical protein
MPPPASRVLPTGDLVRRAIRDLIDNREKLIDVGFVWLVVLVAIDMLLVLAGGTSGGVGTMLLSIGASLVALSAIAVAWHRRVLLAEPVPGPLPTLDARVLRYLLHYLAIGLIGAMAFLLVIGVLGLLPGLAMLALPVAVLAALLVTARLQLVLPATAIDERSVTFARSWRLTDGNTVRLLGGLVLAIAPGWLALLIAPLAGAIFTALGAHLFAQFAILVINACGLLVQAPLMAAYLSFVYLVLREEPGGPLVPQ